MTIPNSKFFPPKKDIENSEDSNKYIIQMVYELKNMYEELSESTNGKIKSSYENQMSNWTPILKGTTTSGSATYSHQIGWVLRKGLFVDVWADIAWSATAGMTGNLYLELPYLVANTQYYPFVGVANISSISLGLGYSAIVAQAIPNTYRCEFWKYGTSIATSPLIVSASGQISLHIRYLGVQDER